jgi:hypothetical protein
MPRGKPQGLGGRVHCRRPCPDVAAELSKAMPHEGSSVGLPIWSGYPLHVKIAMASWLTGRYVAIGVTVDCKATFGLCATPDDPPRTWSVHSPSARNDMSANLAAW